MQQGAVAAGRCVANRQQDVGVRKLVRVIVRQRAACVGVGSKYFFIDSSDNTSDEQRKAAKDFLNWLAEDKEGQEFISKDAALISPFKNNEIEAADPLGKSVKSYADEGKLIDNYNYLPDDHYSVLGAKFQKWLAGDEDRATLAKDVETYWKSAKFTGATA